MQSEEKLLDQGIDQLREILGPGWTITPVNRAPATQEIALGPSDGAEQVVSIYSERGGGGTAQVLVEARESLTPIRARTEFGSKVRLMHRLTGTAAVLVIAPWLSPRSREALEALGYGYLDLTGNVSLRLSQPGIVIRTTGAQQDPTPKAGQGRQGLRGHRAGRLVRVLADVSPPYRATDLARVSGVSLSYTSRILDALEDEALITRKGRTVTNVDWAQLLGARAAHYGLLIANSYKPMVAQQGPERALANLRNHREEIEAIEPVAITGPFAAREIAPAVAVGGQLMLYVAPDSPPNALSRLMDTIGLIPSDVGADVLLLQAADSSVYERTREVNGVTHVALSQLAIDSLSGNGRMPAEGEAVIQFMAEHEQEWRVKDLNQVQEFIQ